MVVVDAAREVDLRPAVVDIIAYSGDDLRLTLSIDDGTGPLAYTQGLTLAQVRSADKSTVLVAFTVDESGATQGRLTLKLTGAQLTTLTTNAGGDLHAVYDVQVTLPLTTGATARTLIGGSFDVQLDTSR
jgi:hypothetical protein